MVCIGVVADDLTGAADTGVQFSREGLETLILSPNLEIKKHFGKVLDEIWLERIPVLVINTRSRGIHPEQARDRVGKAFAILKKRKILYKKVDSTLRGNIGVELEAAMKAVKIRLSIFSAAFPDQNRHTIGGVHLLDNIPLQFTEIAKNTLTPVKHSCVIDIIKEGTNKKVEEIHITKVAADEDTLQQTIHIAVETGAQIIACDAATQKDLDAIGKVALGIKPIPLLCGSAGLARAVAKLVSASCNEKIEVASPENKKKWTGTKILIVCGSTSEVTNRQLNELDRSGIADSYTLSTDVVLDVESENANWLEDVTNIILDRMTEKKVLILKAETPSKGNKNRKEKLTVEVSLALGSVCNSLLRKKVSLFKGIVLTGGDTADAVIETIGSLGLTIRSEVQAGIPFGILYGGKYTGFPVITKAGAFGEKDSLLRCVEFFEKENIV